MPLRETLKPCSILVQLFLKSYWANPECSQSILAYGLSDFAGLSLASMDDRLAICQALQKSISRHEPRLQSVLANLEIQEGSINRLNFAISALLVVNTEQETVNFDAVLQPSTLQYSISKARPSRIGV